MRTTGMKYRARSCGSILVAVGLLWTLGCRSEPERLPPGSLSVSRTVELDLPGSPVALGFHEGGWILAWTDAGRRTLEVWDSRDRGKSWQARIRVTDGSGYAFHREAGDHHFLVHRDGEIRHLRRARGEKPVVSGPVFQRPVRIFSPRFRDGKEVGVVGIETSGGWSQIVFVRSPDHGRTWEAPRPVEPSQNREGSYGPISLLGARRGWIVAWSDARGRRTLFDIWASSSRDGSRWRPATRINDDDTESWQIDPSLAETEEGAVIAFKDWREIDPFWNRNQNVFAARLEGTPLQVAPNTRVTSVSTANQGPVTLAGHPHENLVGAAWIDERQRLTGDVFAAFTRDAGRSWQGETCLSCARPAALRLDPPSRNPILTATENGFLAGWEESWGGERTTVLRELEWTPGGEESDPVGISEPSQSPEPEDLPAIEAREDPIGSWAFENAPIEGWKRSTGSWIVRHGRLLGFGAHPSLLRSEAEPLRDFSLKGRFRLDPVQHDRVFWFFRTEGTEPRELRGWVATAQFRRGFLLQRIEGAFTDPWTDPVYTVADRRFPILQDVWYPFELRVSGEKMELWLEDRKVLAFAELETTGGTGLMLGTARAPVGFDDLELYRLKSRGRNEPDGL